MRTITNQTAQGSAAEDVTRIGSSTTEPIGYTTTRTGPSAPLSLPSNKATRRVAMCRTRVGAVVAAVAGFALGWPGAAFADDVTLNPTGSGAPGTTGVQTFLNWLGQYSLWILLGSVVIGGGIIGAGQLVGHQGAGRGRSAMLGAGMGAMVVGMAPFLVNTLFHTFTS